MKITITVNNANPDTIWGKLCTKLGRHPTEAETRAEVNRILRKARIHNPLSFSPDAGAEVTPCHPGIRPG